jgi:hypothetical protein
MDDAKEADASTKILAVLLAMIVGLLVGGLAVLLQQFYAPFVIFPLLVGMLAGAATLLPLWLVRPRRFILTIVAALSATLGCQVAYHYGTYVVARNEIDRAAKEEVARSKLANQLGDGGLAIEAVVPEPISLGKYYEVQWYVGRPLGKSRVTGPMLVGWWIFDGLLMWLGASLVTASFVTRPAARPAPKPATASSEAGGRSNENPEL